MAQFRTAILSGKRILVACCAVFSATGAAIGGETRASLPVTEGRVSYNQDGFISITGVVRNTTQNWVCAPRIDAEFFDASGKPLGVQSVLTAAKQDAGLDDLDGVYAERIFVPPGEIAVFHYLRDVAKLRGGTAARHRLRASAGECPPQRTTIQVENLGSERDADGYYRLRGTLKNTGKANCRSPRAVIGLYQGDGKVILAREETPDEMFQKQLGPGKSVRFEFRTTENVAQITRSQVWGDCNWPD